MQRLRTTISHSAEVIADARWTARLPDNRELLGDAPGGGEVKHTHPGPLAGYILEGTLVLEHEGRATATYQAGEAFYVDAGKIHYGINSGNVPVKLIATLIVEKGKPPSTPVP